jgi:hypothetical protein
VSDSVDQSPMSRIKNRAVDTIATSVDESTKIRGYRRYLTKVVISYMVSFLPASKEERL